MTYDASKYGYDAAGGTVSFKYDPFGRRIYKSSSSGASIYAFDGDNLIEETNSSGAVVARYEDTQNIDEPLAMLRAGATSYYHADGLGSTTSLSNAAGSIANTYTYDSFGNLTNSTGSLTNPFRYTAREFDSETSLYYYRARYYDPTAGRFLTEDPIHFWAGVNFYTYAHSRPTRFRDPSGKLVIGVIVGGVIGGIEGGMGAGLQGGSTGEIVTAVIIGAAGGAVIGLFDPTEGALTVTQIALIGGAAGFSGDVLGQAIGNLHKPRRCRSFNVGEAVGAGLGGLAGGYTAGVMAVGAASVGAGELGQALMGGGDQRRPGDFRCADGRSVGAYRGRRRLWV